MNEPWPGFRRDFGEVLRRERMRSRLSQADVAVACGVTQPTVHNYESGRRAVPVEFALTASEALGLTSTRLLALTTERRLERQIAHAEVALREASA